MKSSLSLSIIICFLISTQLSFGMERALAMYHIARASYHMIESSYEAPRVSLKMVINTTKDSYRIKYFNPITINTIDDFNRPDCGTEILTVAAGKSIEGQEKPRKVIECDLALKTYKESIDLDGGTADKKNVYSMILSVESFFLGKLRPEIIKYIFLHDHESKRWKMFARALDSAFALRYPLSHYHQLFNSLESEIDIDLRLEQLQHMPDEIVVGVRAKR